MRNRGLLAVFVLLAATWPARAADPEPKTDDEKTLYAIGLGLAGRLGPLGLSASELDMLKAGLTDAVLGRPKKVELEAYGPKIPEFARARSAAIAEKEKKASASFLEKAAAEKGAVKTPSGLIVREITPGKGESPTETDTVKVHYEGRLIDGTVFDSSIKRGEPATFPVHGVIKCWGEGLQKIKVGGKSQLVCPPDLAYGDNGQGDKIKPGATLVFEVELLGIEKQHGEEHPAGPK